MKNNNQLWSIVKILGVVLFIIFLYKSQSSPSEKDIKESISALYLNNFNSHINNMTITDKDSVRTGFLNIKIKYWKVKVKVADGSMIGIYPTFHLTKDDNGVWKAKRGF